MPNNEIIVPATKLATEADYYCCSWGAHPTTMQHKLLPLQFPVKKQKGVKYLTVTDTTTSFIGDFMCQWTTYLLALMAALFVALCATGIGIALVGLALASTGAVAGLAVGATIAGSLAGGAVGAGLGALLCGFLASSHRTWYLPADNVIINGQKVVTQQSFMTCSLFGGQIQSMPGMTFWGALLLTGSNAILIILKCAMIGAGIGTISAFIITASTLGVSAALIAFVKNIALNYKAMWVTGYGLAARGVLGINQIVQDYSYNNDTKYSYVKGFTAVETAPVALVEGTYNSAAQIATQPYSTGNFLGNSLIILTNLAAVPGFATPEIQIAKFKTNLPEKNIENIDPQEGLSDKASSKSPSQQTMGKGSEEDIAEAMQADEIATLEKEIALKRAEAEKLYKELEKQERDLTDNPILKNKKYLQEDLAKQQAEYKKMQDEVIAMQRQINKLKNSAEQDGTPSSAETVPPPETTPPANIDNFTSDNPIAKLDKIHQEHANDIQAEHKALLDLEAEIIEEYNQYPDDPAHRTAEDKAALKKLEDILIPLHERISKLEERIDILEAGGASGGNSMGEGDAYIGSQLSEPPTAIKPNDFRDFDGDINDSNPLNNDPIDYDSLPPEIQKVVRPSPTKLVILFDKIVDLQIPRHVAIIVYSLNKRFAHFYELIIKKEDGKMILNENGQPVNKVHLDIFNIIDFVFKQGEQVFKENSEVYEMPITEEQYQTLQQQAENIAVKNEGTVHGREVGQYNCVTYIADLLRAMGFEIPEGFGRTIIDARNNRGASVPPFKDWILQQGPGWKPVTDIPELFRDLNKIANGKPY